VKAFALAVVLVQIAIPATAADRLAAEDLAATRSGQARTWTVGAADADFPLISPALAAAAEGDTILVGPGVYRENLVLHQRVSIVGHGSPVLIGLGSGSVIRIVAPGCEIRGLVIEGSGAGETNEMDAAIQVASSGNRIAGNTMRRVFYGVVVAAPDNEVADNRITGFLDLPFGRRGDGIYVYRSHGARVLRNHVVGERDGIYFQYAPGGHAEGNVVEASRYALHVMFANDIVIRGNTLRRSSVGANIMESRRIRIEENRIEHNRGGALAVGLALKACDDSAMLRNQLADNARGLQVDGSSRNTFADNRLLYNDAAVLLFASAEQNVFTGNLFDGNWSDVIVSGRGATTMWSSSGRGNRWSGYRGFDFDGDGVGDQAYALVTPFAAIEGANPAARLFLGTPAAAGLELAARAGLTPGLGDSDPHPVVGEEPAREKTAGGHAPGWMTVTLLTLALAVVAVREVSP
jgi:nitrous oxidase accessory protein